MITYTFEPYMVESYARYGSKAYMITPSEGAPFVVSTVVGESDIPALVEFHFNPPVPAPYPDPPVWIPTSEQAVMFDHENRLRSFEGQPPLSLDEFRKKLNVAQLP